MRSSKTLFWWQIGPEVPPQLAFHPVILWNYFHSCHHPRTPGTNLSRILEVQ